MLKLPSENRIEEDSEKEQSLNGKKVNLNFLSQVLTQLEDRNVVAFPRDLFVFVRNQVKEAFLLLFAQKF